MTAQLGFLVKTVQSLAETVVELDRKVNETPQLVLEKLEASLVGVFAERNAQKAAPAGGALRGLGLHGGTNGVPLESTTSMRRTSAFSLHSRAGKPEDKAGAADSANGNEKDLRGREGADASGIALTKAPPLTTFSNLRHSMGGCVTTSGPAPTALESVCSVGSRPAAAQVSGRMHINVTRGFAPLARAWKDSAGVTEAGFTDHLHELHPLAGPSDTHFDEDASFFDAHHSSARNRALTAGTHEPVELAPASAARVSADAAQHCTSCLGVAAPAAGAAFCDHCGAWQPHSPVENHR